MVQRPGSAGRARSALSRVLDLYPTSQPPTPALDTAGERAVLYDRWFAALADLLVCFVLVEAPLLSLVDTLSGGRFLDVPGVPLLSVVLLAPIYVTYSFAFEWRYARTPGKVWRDLTTATTDGRPPSLRASAVRNLLRYVDGVGVPPLLVGTVSALWSVSGQRLGDRLAGTVVVRTR
ncbi:RDD family protein [Halomarina litorea]|uniref:RDD family protein n=1 Tax=Halomarina litorea TaxID=2961595 RepID=UPI0020C44B9E|nr:RDD family protein [Halomarina sp. BCD28]